MLVTTSGGNRCALDCDTAVGTSYGPCISPFINPVVFAFTFITLALYTQDISALVLAPATSATADAIPFLWHQGARNERRGGGQSAAV